MVVSNRRRTLAHLSRLSLGLLGLALLAGCPSNPKPTVEDTVLGGRGGDGARPDFVDTASVYGSGADGLEVRGMDGDGGFGADALAEALAGPADVSIFFDFDQSGVRPDQRGKLEDLADELFARPSATVFVEGRADWRGTTEYNLALGDRRANAVRRYLTTLGVDGTRIETSSKGDLEAVEGASESVMSDDRRADVYLLR